MPDALLLFIAAFLAGALNSVAGGGSFLTLPALVFTGIPPVVANATGTLALLPGYLAGAWALRRDMRSIKVLPLAATVWVSLLGGAIGASLLLWTPATVFDGLIPWLLLLATLLFAVAPRLTKAAHQKPVRRGVVLGVVLVIAIYGGYFNGGLGILLLAAFGILGVGNLHAANGLKNLVSALLTAIAVVVYVAGDIVVWPQALLMMVGATSGGYVAARVSRLIPVNYLRWSIVLIGAAMTVVFFARLQA